jgi:hypothetical protein
MMLEAAGRMAILPRRIRLQSKGAKMAESLPRNFLFEAFVVPGSLGESSRAFCPNPVRLGISKTGEGLEARWPGA